MAELYKIARVRDVPPGEGRVITVGGVEIALFNVDGSFYALNNTCAHMGGPLAEGELDGHVVTCPWHAWHYDVRTGASLTNPEARVAAYPVTVEGEDVTIAL